MQEGRIMRVPTRVQPQKDARVQFLREKWLLFEWRCVYEIAILPILQESYMLTNARR